MKKLTREEWEKVEYLKQLKEERIEKQCEKLSITKPIKERLELIRNILN